MPVATRLTPAGRVVWFALPAHSREGVTSRTGTDVVGMSFTGHHRALTAAHGTERERTFPPDTVSMTGAVPLDWLRTRERSEGIEIHPSAALGREVAELTGVTVAPDDAMRLAVPSPALWARFARLRSSVLREADDGELDELVHGLLVELAVLLGGRAPPHPGALARRDLARVVEVLHRRAVVGIGLTELAAGASMSPSHLLRAFRASTGLTPHGYLTAIRLGRARRELARPGARVASVARGVGYADERQFRRAYRAAFGTSPSGR